MGIAIPDQKKDLEEEHARGPDRRGASKPGKNIPGDDGLYLKQQKGTEKDRNDIGEDRHLRNFWWEGSHYLNIDRRCDVALFARAADFARSLAGFLLPWL